MNTASTSPNRLHIAPRAWGMTFLKMRIRNTDTLEPSVRATRIFSSRLPMLWFAVADRYS